MDLSAIVLSRISECDCFIKDVDQVIESIIAGADSVAVRFPIFEAMCEHPLTDQGMAGFMDDDRKIPQADPTHAVA